MGRKANRIVSCLVLLFSVAPLYAQEAQTEEINLQELQRNYLLNLMVYSDDPVDKHLALQRLAQLLEAGKVSLDDVSATNALTWLAQQGTLQKYYDRAGNLLNSDFSIRIDACNVLGKLKSPMAQSSLVSIMSEDPEPAVVAVAIENLQKISPEGDPRLLEIMADTFNKYHYINRNNTLASSFILTIAKYAKNSEGRLLTPKLLQAVHDISLPNNAYTRAVRTKARSLILSWIGAEYPSYDEIE